MGILDEHRFSPVIYYDNEIPKEFAVVPMKLFEGLHAEQEESPSAVVERFYHEKDSMTRIRSKSAELKSTVQTHFERTAKKLGILKKQLADTEKKDKYKVYGELITTYGYSELPPLPLPESSEEVNEKLVLTCINYHNDTEVSIPIDPRLSVPDNANATTIGTGS